MTETGACSICGDQYTRYGNNAQPINDGRCCDSCNQMVIAARMRNIQRGLPRDHQDIDGQHRHNSNKEFK